MQTRPRPPRSRWITRANRPCKIHSTKWDIKLSTSENVHLIIVNEPPVQPTDCSIARAVSFADTSTCTLNVVARCLPYIHFSTASNSCHAKFSFIFTGLLGVNIDETRFVVSQAGCTPLAVCVHWPLCLIEFSLRHAATHTHHFFYRTLPPSGECHRNSETQFCG